MKKSLLFVSALTCSLSMIAQQQIGNGDFEQWESVTDELNEPVNWNSFQTATGTWSTFAGQQMDWSTDVRPGTTGSKSVKIWTADLGISLANGNVTLGQIKMGSTTATSSSNYNFSITGDPNFSEPLTDTPDSLVFWVKYTPVSGGSQARVSAVLHDSYDYKDGYNIDASSAPHKVAEISYNYPSTNGVWERHSVVWNYTGPASANTYVIITFTTNMTPAGGDGNDEVLIDDIELIYNPNSVDEMNADNIKVGYSNDMIFINSATQLEGNYTIYASNGAMIQEGTISNQIPFTNLAGVYFVKLKTAEGEITKKISLF